MGGFLVIIAVVLALCWGGYFYWRRKIDAEIAEGAEIEWAHFQKHEPEFVKGYSKEKFFAVFDRVNRPRFPTYALAAFSTFLATLPISFGALVVVLWIAEKLGMTPAPVETAERFFLQDGEMIFFKDTPPEAALYYARDLGGFYYFFGVLFVWLVIVAIFMHRFHKTRPGYLRDEIIRSRPASAQE